MKLMISGFDGNDMADYEMRHCSASCTTVEIYIPDPEPSSIDGKPLDVEPSKPSDSSDSPWSWGEE
jgi:hypothetical protein